jgi:hypothetical protein
VADKKDDDDLYDMVSGMADRLKLEGKERSRYIHEHMTRGGYRAVPNYVKADEEDEDDKGSGFFGGSRSRSGRSRRSRDDDTWYED